MAKKKEKFVKVTLVKSTIACPPDQRKVVESLGLKKIRQCKQLPDNACVRGMVAKVSHLVSIEEVK